MTNNLTIVIKGLMEKWLEQNSRSAAQLFIFPSCLKKCFAQKLGEGMLTFVIADDAKAIASENN